MDVLKVGDKVKATVTKGGGYWEGQYVGVIVGFTANGRIKVEGTYKHLARVRIHAASNISLV